MLTNGKSKFAKLFRLVWKISIISFVLLAAYYFIDFKNLVDTLSQLTLPWIIALVSIATVDRFLMGFKWHHLTSLLQINFNLRAAIRIYYEASFLSYVFSTSLTGDAYRGYAANQIDPGLSKIVSSIFVEKIIAILSAGLLACVGLILLRPILQNTNLNFLAWLIPLLFFISLIVFVYSLVSQNINKLIEFIPVTLVHKYTKKLYSSYEKYSGEKKGLMTNFFLALLEHSIQYSIVYVSALALNIHLSPIELISIIAITQFIRKFAIILEGWTLGEFLTIAGFVAIGVNQTDALAFSLLYHAVVLAASIPGGFFLARTKFSSVKK